MIWKEDLVSCNPSNQFSKMPSRLSKKSLILEEWEESENFNKILVEIEEFLTIIIII